MSGLVTTDSGTVRGLRTDDVGAFKRTPYAFKGIPYAAPPVQLNRFQPPQPVEPWTGVRDATEYGPTAPKARYIPPLDRLIPEIDIPGDDYLNLNVWTPSPGAHRLPVMVFLHGGAFINGSGSVYDGSAFARDGIVLVTINYRLGADGFLDVGEGANRGLLDQIAALHWVQRNIAAFGGDPDQVTLFGQSAGAMAVGTLLGMPAAAGLFHRAILQSGAAHNAASPASAQRIGRLFAGKLGVEPTMVAVADVPVDQLVLAQQQLRLAIAANPDPALWGDAAYSQLAFSPVIDGETLPGPPIERLPDIDLMVGSTSDEYRLYVVPTGVFDAIEEGRLLQLIERYGLDVEQVRAAYPGAANEQFVRVMTDWFFRIPAIRLAEASGRAHMYEFAWQPSSFDGRLGACHASELPFVFDSLGNGQFDNLLGTDLPQELADSMHAAWVSFATTGNPGWPDYRQNHSTMRFDTTNEVVTDPRGEQRAVWEGHR
jgi:para-nitrobenzyl esterase